MFTVLRRPRSMHLPRMTLRLRLPAFGALTAWRSRRAQAAMAPSVREDHAGIRRRPVLSRVVGVRRVGAALDVDLIACSAPLDGRSPVLLRSRSGAAAARAIPERDRTPDGDGRFWTVTLSLN